MSKTYTAEKRLGVCPPEVEHFTVLDTLPAPCIVRSGHLGLGLTAGSLTTESSRKWRGLV